MEFTQITSAVAIAGASIALLASIGNRKFRMLSAAMLCLICAQVPTLVDFDPGGWISLCFAVLTLVFAVLHLLMQSRDPEWKASWRK